VATVKAVGGMVFYPLMWIVLAIWAGVRLGVVWGVIVVVALPLLAWLALRVFEALDDVVGRMRGALQTDLEPRRHELIGEFVSIAEEMGMGGR
jgi:small basic protein